MNNFKSDFKEIISMKQKTWLLLPLVLAVSHAWADGETVEQEGGLDPVVVTGAVQQKANTVRFNPKATIQPMPAGDGADLLQSVPNMSVIRKGGSSGDPLFSRPRRLAFEHQRRRPIHLRRLLQPHGPAHSLYFPNHLTTK